MVRVGWGSFGFLFCLWTRTAHAQPAQFPTDEATAPPAASQPSAVAPAATTTTTTPTAATAPAVSSATAPPPSPAPLRAAPAAANQSPAVVTAAHARAPNEARLPDWNIGAGLWPADSVSFAGLLLGSSPSFAASLERRASANNWLFFNGLGSYESHDQALVSSGAPLSRASIPLTTFTGELLVGLRHVVLSRVVEVSLFSDVFVGRQRIDHGPLNSEETLTSPSALPSRAWLLGVNGGIVVERQLVEGLALRLPLSLLTASYAHTETETLDQLGVGTPHVLDSYRLSVSPRAGLEIHLYF